MKTITRKYVKDVMQNAKEKIEKWLEFGGHHTHNMISLSLRNVSEKIGYKYANQLIDEFDLKKEFGIKKINKKGIAPQTTLD